MSERPSQRAWQRERTERALRAAAVELFEAQGYDAVTVDDIAERAGVTARTFFRYFPNKEDVLLDQSTASDPLVVAAILDAPPELGPVEATAHAMGAVMRQLPYDAAELSRGLRIALSTPTLRGRLTELMGASESLLVNTLLQRQGGHRRAEAELAAAAIMAVQQRVLTQWAEQGATGDLIEALERALDALARGFHARTSAA